MARPLWSGSISFGLVNIPVRLHSAVRSDDVRFHLISAKDHSRLRRKMVCPAHGKEVPPEHIVKGYEVKPGQFVVVSDEDLESVAPEESRTVQILDFVEEREIDPVYYDHPYYIVPAEGSAKAYKLLADAMTKAKKVAIAKFVMREKEHLAALRPTGRGGAIVLETMHFGEEVMPLDEVPDVPIKAKVDERALKMAEQLIESLTSDFEPKKYQDEHQRRVEAMIERKSDRATVSVPSAAAAEEKPRVINLMAALEASLKEAKKKRKPSSHETRRRKSA